MTTDALIRNPAQAYLESLALCDKIKPGYAGDEEVICRNDMIDLIPTSQGWQHNPDTIRRLRESATGWPK